MMDLGKIIYAALAGDVGVTAIAGTRIYPGVIPQEIDRPCVSYDIGSLPGVDGTAPVHSTTVNASCFAREKNDAHSLADAVDGKLEGLRGEATGVSLRSLYKASYQEAFDTDLNVYAVLLTYDAVVVLM